LKNIDSDSFYLDKPRREFLKQDVIYTAVYGIYLEKLAEKGSYSAEERKEILVIACSIWRNFNKYFSNNVYLERWRFVKPRRKSIILNHKDSYSKHGYNLVKDINTAEIDADDLKIKLLSTKSAAYLDFAEKQAIPKAKPWIRKALELDPDNPNTNRVMGKICLMQNLRRKGKTYFKKADNLQKKA